MHILLFFLFILTMPLSAWSGSCDTVAAEYDKAVAANPDQTVFVSDYTDSVGQLYKKVTVISSSGQEWAHREYYSYQSTGSSHVCVVTTAYWCPDYLMWSYGIDYYYQHLRCDGGIREEYHQSGGGSDCCTASGSPGVLPDGKYYGEWSATSACPVSTTPSAQVPVADGGKCDTVLPGGCPCQCDTKFEGYADGLCTYKDISGDPRIENNPAGYGTFSYQYIGTCSDGVKNGDETGIDTGGSCFVGPPAPTCSDGAKNGDETGIDTGGSCFVGPPAPTCSDGVKNGDETGIDTGGSCTVGPPAPTCSDGFQNGDEVAIDYGGSCGTCSDGIQNGNEAAIDYGGRCGVGPSPPGGTCKDGIQNGDETGIDTGGRCGEIGSGSCSDGVQNGDETGIDTGGRCAVGSDADCSTTFCVDKNCDKMSDLTNTPCADYGDDTGYKSDKDFVGPPAPEPLTITPFEKYVNESLGFEHIGDYDYLFQTFWSDMKKTPLVSLIGSFFGAVPQGGGDSVVSFDAGRYGRHSYDFASWGFILDIVKALILIICGYVAIRIVILKG